MIKNIPFRHVTNNFLAKLKNYIKEINNTDELLINADNSTNIYKFSADQYKKHLCDNVTKTYKKSNRNKVNKRDDKRFNKRGYSLFFLMGIFLQHL